MVDDSNEEMRVRCSAVQNRRNSRKERGRVIQGRECGRRSGLHKRGSLEGQHQMRGIGSL